jgi:cytochrome c-type biogenesis protein
MSTQVSLLAAFGAGVVSFLSPCVLPLVPAYISFVTGMSLEQVSAPKRRIGRILPPVLLFVAGFTAVFVALGAGASVLGSLLNANKVALTRFAGVVVFVLGFLLLDVVPLPALRRSVGVDAERLRSFGPLGSLALGLAFPFALGACAGPIYGAILTLAADGRSLGAGALLLFAYSLGLALPFVAVSLAIAQLGGALSWFKRHAVVVRRVSGVVLMAMGLAMAMGWLVPLTAFLRSLPLLRGIG